MRDEDLYLFNRKEFLDLQRLPDRHTLVLNHPRTGTLQALWHIHGHNGRGWSPRRATFGGPQCDADLPPERLALLLDAADALARRQGWEALTVALPPAFLEPAVQPPLVVLLHARGYRLAHTDLTYYLPCDGTPFTDRLHATARKKRRRALDHGLRAAPDPDADLTEVYDLLVQTRRRRGYPVTMDQPAFAAAARQLPHRYHVWTVRRGPQLVAAAWVVQLRHDLLYTLYVGDDVAHRAYSPVVLLYEAIYAWGVTRGCRYLDFGIGTAASVPNPGLMQFKRSLGGMPSLKFTLEKNF